MLDGLRGEFSIAEGIVKLTDCRLFSAFLHEPKPLKSRRAPSIIDRNFGVNPVNLTKPLGRLAPANQTFQLAPLRSRQGDATAALPIYRSSSICNEYNPISFSITTEAGPTIAAC